MAGHSHWSKIKRAKGANDAKRGKIWSKVAKKIMIAAKNGSDPRDNLNLRYVIDEAKGVNMPKDTIEKAIKKAGVKPSDFVDGKPPAGLSAADKRSIVDAADQVRSEEVVQAASGIEQQGRDVCKVNLGL